MVKRPRDNDGNPPPTSVGEEIALRANAMAASRADVKVRITESPQLTKYIERCEANISSLQARVLYLEDALDKKTQENKKEGKKGEKGKG